MTPEQALINKIAEVSQVVGFQAGIGATEFAGQIVSVLFAKPELIPDFLERGSAMVVDGDFHTENGALTYVAANGEIMSPSDLRKAKGQVQ
jgi:hypothetical protein